MNATRANKADLSQFNNGWYNPGRNFLVRTLWYYVNAFVFKSYLFPVYGMKSALLRLFGATVGKGLVIKPNVNIKYPWHLAIGDHVWIGEEVWIDNLTTVQIGNNVCLSQGAMLLTGNHNYKKTAFDLIVSGITLEEGAWIGARSTVCPGVTCHSHAILSVGSVAYGNLAAYEIYQGIPAVSVRQRVIEE